MYNGHVEIYEINAIYAYFERVVEVIQFSYLTSRTIVGISTIRMARMSLTKSKTHLCTAIFPNILAGSYKKEADLTDEQVLEEI